SPVSHLVNPEGAEERIAPQARDDLRSSSEYPRLRSAQQFVAAEGDEIGSGSETVSGERFLDSERSQIDDTAAAEVLIHRQLALPPQRHHVVQPGTGGESRDPEVARMDAQKKARALGDGIPVVFDAGAVGGSHFAEHGSGACHDIGDAEAVADLDQL